MTMEQVLHIVKFVGLVQLAVVIVSFFLFYVLRVIFKINNRRLNKKIEKISQLLNALINHEIKLTPQLVQFFKKNVRELLGCMKKLEVRDQLLPNWIKIRIELSNKVLKPQARRLAKSSNRQKKYLAVLCYEYGIEGKDEEMLCKLVRSEIFIVSLNSARVIFKYPTPKTTSALIDSLAQGRRIQQSLYAEILASEQIRENEILINTFTDRLTSEQDPYIRTFCYRILMLLTRTNKALKTTETDILSENLDLKIASLRYLSRFQDNTSRQTLRQFLNDSKLEVRAVTAKLLGEIRDEESIPILEEKLHDSAWWVRINAAEALSTLGEKGMLALQQQSADVDKFAYETAQKVLITFLP
jgi:hypothetical protein